jgi:hypothetical protein
MGVGRNELHTIGMQALAMIERIGGKISEKQLAMTLVKDAPMKDYTEIIRFLTDMSGELVRVPELGHKGLVKRTWLVLKNQADQVRQQFATAQETDDSEPPPPMQKGSSALGNPAQ